MVPSKKLPKGSRLIISRREGKEVYYKAADTQPARQLHRMIEKLVEIACPLTEKDLEKDPCYDKR